MWYIDVCSSSSSLIPLPSPLPIVCWHGQIIYRRYTINYINTRRTRVDCLHISKNSVAIQPHIRYGRLIPSEGHCTGTASTTASGSRRHRRSFLGGFLLLRFPIKPYCKRMIIYMRTKELHCSLMGTKCVKVGRSSWASKLGYFINPFGF
jgi:hypothetical protein